MTHQARRQDRSASGLRRRAELEVRKTEPPNDYGSDLPRLVHELRVHQIELEMQNEELTQARVELETSLGRYQNLYENSPIGYVELDRRGRILRANSMAVELLGVPKAKLVRRPLAARCTAASGDVLHRHLRGLFETEGMQSAQIQVRRPDGAALDLALESRIGDEGQSCHMALIDVSQRERASAELEAIRAELESRVVERTAQLTRTNEQLAESEERFRLLAENAYDVVFRYTLQPRTGFEYLSPSVMAMTGHQPEAFYADPDLLPTLCAAEDRAKVASVLSGDASFGEAVEVRFLYGSGAWRWADLRASGVYDVNGHVVAVEGIARDVTERKRAELALKRAHDELEQRVEERTRNLAAANEALIAEFGRRKHAEWEVLDREANLRNLIETVPDGVIGLDERGSIQSFNPAAERIFGYSADEVAGSSLKRLISDPDPDGRPSSVLHFDATGALRVVGTWSELTGVRKDGSTFPMEVGMGEVADGGSILVCVVRDVSEKQRLERELRQSQKMEAIGSLASGIAHDFNNLLQGIIGCADLALGRLAEDAPAYRFVDVLKQASMSGAGVVGQLMDFSRKREVVARVFDLNRLVSDQDTLFGRLVGEDVQLRLGLGPDVSPVRCDPNQIEQVLMNLLVNARHAMPGGGEIEIETAEVEFAADSLRHVPLAPGRYIALSVRDTGHGMDEATQQHVFEPFFTTKEEGRGTGLGLSGVHSIVSRAGGHVEVTSQVGEGTTFTVYLPRSDEPIVRVSEASAVGGQRGTETVLLVEDEPLVQMSVRYYLDRRGYRVLVANDASQARAILADTTEPIHLLVTDVTLPGGNGLQIAAEARERRPELRVLCMTASPRERLLEQYGVGVGEAILRKPFSEAELISRVRIALHGSTLRPSGPGGSATDAGEMPSIPVTPPLSSDAGGAGAHRGPAPPLAFEPEASEVRPASGTPSPVLKRAHVLVVEDEPFARLASREVLEEQGYRVTEASSAQAALAAWRKQEGGFDVVLSDIGLPDVSGIELVRQLRAERPDLAVVLVSGWLADDPEVRALRNAPRTALLEKPVELARIVAKVASTLGEPRGD